MALHYIVAERLVTHIKAPFQGVDDEHSWGRAFLTTTEESARTYCEKKLHTGEPYQDKDRTPDEIHYTGDDEDPIYIVKAVASPEDDLIPIRNGGVVRETVIRVSQGDISGKYVVLTHYICNEAERNKRYLYNLENMDNPETGYYFWGTDLQAFVFSCPKEAFLFAVKKCGMSFKDATKEIAGVNLVGLSTQLRRDEDK